MQDRFESLESGEVISVQHDTQVLSGHRTFRVGELNDSIESYLKSAIANWNEEHNGWLNPQGIECEALRFGSQGWQKGRIRLCLEFCPDEPNSAAQGTIATSISTGSIPLASGQAISPPTHHSVTATPDAHASNSSATVTNLSSDASANTTATTVTNLSSEAIADNADNANPPTANNIPIVGVAAVGVIGTVAAAAAMTPADLHPTDTHQIIPHFAETTLEQEERQNEVSQPGAFDEIAYDFGHQETDLGVATPNGMMELDLADLGLDFSDSDLLSFETSGIAEGTDEFLNLQDTSKSENSGMLIDEVWNEIQGNWPGIN
jgi:KGK domain